MTVTLQQLIGLPPEEWQKLPPLVLESLNAGDALAGAVRQCSAASETGVKAQQKALQRWQDAGQAWKKHFGRRKS